jgi:hypothetical protein
MIVSRKRTRNLFDLTSLWKKMVLTGYDQEVSDHPATVTDTHNDGDNGDSDAEQYVAQGLDQLVTQQTAFEQGFYVRDGSPVRVRHGVLDGDSD